jgi:hypothetical protein
MIHTIRAGDSSQLQSALNLSQPGDEIVLPAGARYVGTFTLPPKTNEVVLRCEHFTQPLDSLAFPFTRRVTPADVGLMPRIASGSSGRAIDGTGAKNWTLHGIRFEPNVGGYGEVLGFEGAENIILDCILLVVPEGQQQKRGVLGNGKHVTLTRSHLSGIWREGQDSQAFAAWDGPGPYTLTDNYLEAASENILFGGADASSEANIPADILIEGNTITKNLAWKGQPRQVKNLLELKCAKRVVIRGNRLEHNWADAQSGFAVLFTPRNQDGSAPFTVVQDVLFERNTLRDIPRGLNIAGYDDLNASQQTTGIVVRDNVIETDGIGCLIHHHVGTVAVYRNDFGPTEDRAILSLDRNDRPVAAANLTWAENSGGGYIHSPTAIGDKALLDYTWVSSLDVPASDAPLPSVPPVQEGPPEPLPGEQVEAPSVPERDLAAEVDQLTDTVLAVSTHLSALGEAHDRLVAYLGATPKVSRIEQLRSYLKGAGQ